MNLRKVGTMEKENVINRIEDISKCALIGVPARGAGFTKAEWLMNSDMKYKQTVDQQEIAELVITESKRIRDETLERSKLNKETTDRRIEERIEDIEFNRKELQKQRDEISTELEAMDAYKARLVACLNSVDNSRMQCNKCILLRERRMGIDLVVDEVGQALQNEINIINGSQGMLTKVLEQTVEQIRSLRAVRYLIDQDLSKKDFSVVVDDECSKLKLSDLGLSIYQGISTLDPANISIQEWQKYSHKNIIMASKAVTSARPIRVMINTLLIQAFEDLQTANAYCNRTFKIRIDETKKDKDTLEKLLNETFVKIEDMTENICALDQTLGEQMGYLALAHTRLLKRAQRPGVELVKDGVSLSLKKEVEMLKYSQGDLTNALEEAKATLRYLLQTQVQLEEDINVKLNTIKIDEVECMTIRETMIYNEF